jgi:hypothetical protein
MKIVKHILVGIALSFALVAPCLAQVAKTSDDSGTVFSESTFNCDTAGTCETRSYAGYTIGTCSSNCQLAAWLSLGSGLERATPTSAACTWNGVSMNALGNQHSSDDAVRIYAFNLASPATGNHTLACTWTGAMDSMLQMLTMTGSGTPTFTSTSGSSAAPAISPTSTSTGATFSMVAVNGNVVSWAGTSITPYTGDNNTFSSGWSAYEVGHASPAYTGTTTNAPWVAATIIFPQASGAARTCGSFSLVGVGKCDE